MFISDIEMLRNLGIPRYDLGSVVPNSSLEGVTRGHLEKGGKIRQSNSFVSWCFNPKLHGRTLIYSPFLNFY